MTWLGALTACTALGLQHGIDVDHVAAITDVTSIQRTPGESIRSGVFYAAGHAATVGLLGAAVILLRHSLPAIDTSQRLSALSVSPRQP
jgi:high-affinity nickel-transport protein